MMSVPIRAPAAEIEGRAYRRRVSAADTLRILAEADACAAPGAIGACCAAEGRMRLTTWRAQRAAGSRRDASRHRPRSARMSGCAKSPPLSITGWETDPESRKRPSGCGIMGLLRLHLTAKEGTS